MQILTFPARIDWADGTSARFETQAAHFSAMARCRHESIAVRVDGGIWMTACRMCASARMWPLEVV